jgi:hypothetical protein
MWHQLVGKLITWQQLAGKLVM